MSQVLINGNSFSATDISVIVAGVTVASIKSLTIASEAEKVNNYGFGRQPASRGRGATEYECSVELAYKDVLRLRALSPSGSLLDIPKFNVLAVMNNGETVARIRANAAEFTQDGIEVSQGDTETVKEYALVIAGIDYL